MMSISKFYELSMAERRRSLCDRGISPEILSELLGYADCGNPVIDVHARDGVMDAMIENAIGAYPMPLGVVPDLCINGRSHAILMATEEPSVIAGLNRVSRVFNDAGGTISSMSRPVTQAQIAVAVDACGAADFVAELGARREEWLKIADASNPALVAAGGGAIDCSIEAVQCPIGGNDALAEMCLGAGAREIPDRASSGNGETLVVATIDVATCDAMGANAVNAMAEALARAWNARYGSRFGYAPCMAILSNRARGRRVRACIAIGEKAIETYTRERFDDFAPKIARASRFAQNNAARAVTHNKGILNGIVAAAVALGQDTRAISAAAIDDACAAGSHRSLAQWCCAENPQTRRRALAGVIELPLPVGFIGGTRQVPHIDAAFRFSGIDSISTLTGILASVGLAQNFAALWALVTGGIQKGHILLHEKKARIGRHGQ